MDSYEYADDVSVSAEDVEFDYPTPAESSEAGTKDGESSKKKRKAWGQPVPEIVPILPPRKRAKTAEEKEQRKNERILRNRRAADKSRQRQKAAQAELEQQNKDLLVENAQLRDLLKQHGLMGEYKPPIEQLTPPASVCMAPPSVCDDSPQDDLSQLDDSSSQIPTFSYDSTTTTTNQPSTTLTPVLDLGKADDQASTMTLGMTQYPAVSAGGLGYEATINPFAQLETAHSAHIPPLPDNCEELFDWNALSNVPSLPDFGGDVEQSLVAAGMADIEQLPIDSYFNFDACDLDAASSFPSEAPQQASGLQS